ncbi:MAG: cytochrome c [Hyphomicrobiaceae bacterium]
MAKAKNLGSVLLAAGFAVAVTSAAFAADVIKERKALMKAVGGATKASAAMVKGEAKFDAAKAAKAMKTIADSAPKFAKMFPANSKTGGETTAAPKIWTDMKDFVARMDKFRADAAAAEKAAGAGEAAFKTAFAAVAKSCKGCHDVYRVKKK